MTDKKSYYLNVKINLFICFFSVSRTVRRVMDALIQMLPQYMHPPIQQEAQHQKVAFSVAAGFPGVFGCVDGTHVKILRPHVDEEVYVNRKNFHSLNVQVSSTHYCQNKYRTSFKFRVLYYYFLPKVDCDQ